MIFLQTQITLIFSIFYQNNVIISIKINYPWWVWISAMSLWRKKSYICKFIFRFLRLTFRGIALYRYREIDFQSCFVDKSSIYSTNKGLEPLFVGCELFAEPYVTLCIQRVCNVALGRSIEIFLYWIWLGALLFFPPTFFIEVKETFPHSLGVNFHDWTRVWIWAYRNASFDKQF